MSKKNVFSDFNKRSNSGQGISKTAFCGMTLSNLVGTYRPGRKEISQNADKAFDGKIYRRDNWTVDFTQTNRRSITL